MLPRRPPPRRASRWWVFGLVVVAAQATYGAVLALRGALGHPWSWLVGALFVVEAAALCWSVIRARRAVRDVTPRSCEQKSHERSG